MGKRNLDSTLNICLTFCKGPIKFIFLVSRQENNNHVLSFWCLTRLPWQVADTWVKSLDTVLDAYEEIGEKLPAFTEYKALFEKNPELRRALGLYFYDIMEFHFQAAKFLNRPGDYVCSLLLFPFEAHRLYRLEKTL